MRSLLVSIGIVLLVVETLVGGEGGTGDDEDNGLTARELLHTIAPTYHLAKVPPGFPPLGKMNTDNFSYGTRGKYIKVVAKLNKTVKMVKNYIELTHVRMNFTYDKQQPENGTWRFYGKGNLQIGQKIIEVSISEDGKIDGMLDEISFEDLLKAFNQEDFTTTNAFDSQSIILESVVVSGKVFKTDGFFYLTFSGVVGIDDAPGSYGSITVAKAPNDQLKLYAVLEFRNLPPSTVLKEIADDETLDIPFFSKILTDSDLLASNKSIFGVTISLSDVYNFTYNTPTGEIIKDVLQSHIPSGVTLLCPVGYFDKKKMTPVKLAFVMKRPNFDFLVDKHDKIALKRVLKALSSELAPPSLPVFLRRTKKAFTSHISFNSVTKLFSIFVRMRDEIGLAPGVINSRVRSIVLVKNVSRPNSGDDWKLSVRGSLLIGKTKLRMRYAQMGSKPEKVYGLTAMAKRLTLEDIVKEFDPEVFGSKEAKEMIENTEIADFEMENVNLFSRITRTNTPHLLITGKANLPAWEDRVRVSLLLLLDKKQWYMKIALTLLRSPLSNVLQAFTGFDLQGASLLHNNNIISSIISSPLPSYSLLPPKIITTPLLRIPAATGITIIALFRFPDNCGDDNICIAANQLLDTKVTYTFRGVLSLSGFTLEAPVSDVINLGNGVQAVNSTLEFTFGNKTELNLVTTLKIRETDYVFDGRMSFLKSGKIRAEMWCRKHTWVAPFGISTLQFRNLSLNTTFDPKDTFNWMQLKGITRVGAIGNGNEVEAPLNLDFNPSMPEHGRFYSNFSHIEVSDLMKSLMNTIDYDLPYVLRTASFPNGLMLQYSSFDMSESSHIDLHGDMKILGRVLSCHVEIVQPALILITTSNSPAPVILGNGQIIIGQDAENELRGPRIVATINHKQANVSMAGYVKILGMESRVNVSVNEDVLSFKINGKLMNFKDTELTASSQSSLDDFKVSGCFDELPEQVQLLLTEIIEKAGNQSTVNIERAEKNLVLAGHYFENANQHEILVRTEKEDLRRIYERQLMDYGRFEVRANDTCKPLICDVTCFGCPEWSSCCHRDIFGECIKCASWKKCCWKDVDPICIAEDDGCRIIRSVAESQLSERQIQIEEEKIHLDKLEAMAVESEENKGKHKAVLEAAMDAKRLVVEDSGPGLNSADAIRNFGSLNEWISIDSVCYNTTLEEAATGCMYFHVKGSFYKGSKSVVSIGSCLKEELVNELSESLANYMFPGIVDTSSDDVTDVQQDDDNSRGQKGKQDDVKEVKNDEQKSSEEKKQADQNEKDADQNEKDTDQNEQDTNQNEKDADQNAKEADQNENDADQNETNADQNAQGASQNAKEADQNENDADHNEQDADRNAQGTYHNMKEADQNGKETQKEVLEQDALYQRGRRDVRSYERELNLDKRSSRIYPKSHRMLLENPFWEIKINSPSGKPRSRIPVHPVKKQLMKGMMHKRWRIPENAAGRCHIFHQLVDICKEMAETMILMDKSLTSTIKRYKKEKTIVSGKAASSLVYLGDAAKKIELNDTTFSSVDQTLQVVNQGIDIWASKCEKELNWQNSVGLQNWLTSMDLRIQELGGFGVDRFLDNLFHAFEALFEAATYSDENADQALTLLQRIRKISTAFDRIFRGKLSVRMSFSFAKEILHHLTELKHETLFCT